MSSDYQLRDLHAQRVLVALEIGGKSVTVAGVAEYDSGELRIPIKGMWGGFTLILQDSDWDGVITAAPGGDGFVVRLKCLKPS